MSYPFNSGPSFGNNNGIWKAKPSSATLPLYKDKPLHKSGNNIYITSINKRGGLIKMLFKLSILFFAIYWLYQLGQSFKDNEVLNGTDLWLTRKQEVKSVFLESWHDYEQNGWGYDVYHPVSQRGENMGPKPLGWIIVDSLDTLMIMDCVPELERAKAWVKDVLTYDFNYEVNVFETTIRMLGGFLSSFYISNDDLYLDKAVDLGNRLIKGFESRTGIPYASINLQTGKGVKSHADGGASSTAEVATLQLEFKYLAKLTGESLYWDKVEKIMSVLDSNKPKDGLVPIFVHPETGKYQGRLIRLGSRGDSYYEYLLKQYLQTHEPIYKEMYDEAVTGIKKHLVAKSKPNGYTYIGELSNGLNTGLEPKMDHLVCFIGGLFAAGATEGANINVARKSPGWSTSKEAEFTLGKELTHTCYKMYHDVEKTGLAPEIVVFNQDPKSITDFHIKPLDRHNLQRPETVESLYYLYKITGDPMYRKWGYEIFQNFVEHTKVTEGGVTRYTSLDDVTTGKQRDNMESFWLAETLKYLYLLFDDNDQFDLTKVVFNTEAHIFPDFEMRSLFKTGWSRTESEPVAAASDNDDSKIVKPAAIKLERENIAIKDSDKKPNDIPVGGVVDQRQEEDDDDILNPNIISQNKHKNSNAASSDKPKIQAEKSFNENDKKQAINQDSKVLKSNQNQNQIQKPSSNEKKEPGKKLEVQKPSKPIAEAVKDLELDDKHAIVDEDKVKKFKNLDEINKKIEELINEEE